MDSPTTDARVRRMEIALKAQAEKIVWLQTKGIEQQETIKSQGQQIRAYASCTPALLKAVFKEGRWVQAGSFGGEADGGGQSERNPWEWTSHLPKNKDRLADLSDQLVTMILGWCDRPVIARFARVSFRYLELTAGLLYKDMTLNEIQAEALFCQRDLGGASERVNQLLSFKNTRHITLDNTVDQIGGPSGLQVRVAKDRLAGLVSGAIELEELTVKSPCMATELRMWWPVMNILDPTALSLYGRGSNQIAPLRCDLADWSRYWKPRDRLRIVSFHGEAVGVDLQGNLAIKPREGRGRWIKCHVEEDCPDSKGGVRTEEVAREDVVRLLAGYEEDGGWRKFGRTVLVVQSVAGSEMETARPKDTKGGLIDYIRWSRRKPWGWDDLGDD